jgi:hypothetical protein
MVSRGGLASVNACVTENDALGTASESRPHVVAVNGENRFGGCHEEANAAVNSTSMHEAWILALFDLLWNV